MAGHSHAKNVKRKKEAEDKKRAAAFSRVSRLIISAVREGGEDPEFNPQLRTAIEKAKGANMPKENIERAIKRGSGEGEEGALEPFLFEGYGPEGTAFIIEGKTDNRNRILGEIKGVLRKYGGRLANPGAVKWLFDPIGIIELESEEESWILYAIEEGAREVEEEEGQMFVFVSPQDLSSLTEKLRKKGAPVVSSSLGWKAKNNIPSKESTCKKIKDNLEEKEEIEGVYTNTNI